MAVAEVMFRASTDDVDAGAEFDYWADTVSTTFVPLECSSASRGSFQGELVSRSLGDFQFARIVASAHRVSRTRRMIERNDQGLLKVCVQLEGTARISQEGRQAEVLPGDFAIYDTSRPYVLSFDHTVSTRTFVFMFPQAQLGIPYDDLRRVTAVSVSGREGVGLVASPFFRAMAEASADGSLMLNGRLAHNAIALLETVYRERLDQATTGERVSRSRLLVVQAWLDHHLQDPGLSPDLIAGAHNISVRYLHRLFADDGTSVSRWVKVRRLEGCRRELGDPSLARFSVGAIAARWGMLDAPSFSRAFRDAYGLSPREYRMRP